ncbi:ATP-dependent zinc metalloprotease FtsH [Bombilactobacillus mellis]|uniref:ATP-dependent zinc metalloprotease FtsH n=1 Tax=Bombilactobacillus mellis TaxID=1218508 RepID=A0A0F4KZ85_9LACO|nr:ATP-dependent zinc metalloprotease FtsH [Bombilactobacillus mellis]KJY51274.1 ATP-dependent zinc metalloprotease FtsH [Bombilactobacillus mellis]NUG66872.1 ATP-dependent zinc metalloprotease FtsH [Bombilactobacillus mellis]
MKNNRNGLRNNSLFYIIIFILLILATSWFVGGQGSSATENLTSNEFITQLRDNKVEKFSLQPSNGVYKVSGTLKRAEKQKSSNNNLSLFGKNSGQTSSSKQFSATVLPNDASLNQISQAAQKTKTQMNTHEESQNGMWLNLAITVVPFLIFFFFLYSMMSQAGQGGGGAGKIMSFGKSQTKPVDPKKNKVRFSDVAGAEEEKQELVEVVDFLRDPRKYLALGARIPSGVLLEGPPGTGKTLLARAVAGEAKVPFYSISGSDFVEMFVGVGASRVRDLFTNAKKNAPAIIFIDEIDAIGRQRGNGKTGGGNDEREQTLNQLLVEMDGFTGKEGIIVIAATNRSDVLDPALLRPGRFDRKILVGQPDVKGREAILRVHAKNKPLAEDVDLKVIAQQTPGFVGADLENVLNEGALVAAERNKTKIDAADIDEAEDRVIAGPAKKDRIISPEERKMVAYHEAGHAIIGVVLSDSRVVRKVTIIPRGRAGGYAIMLPKEDQNLLTKKDLMEQVAGLMGGRTAEEIIFHSQSSGASNDFEQATQIARAMVTEYGMSERLGMTQLEKGGAPVGAYGQPNYSQETATIIDDEVRKILDEAHKTAIDIIQSHREQHKAIAEALLKYETLDERQILSLYNTGKMPVNNQEEFPSEKASTFEEAKKIAQLRDEKKQAKEGHNFDPSAPLETPSEKSDQQSDPNQKNDDQPTTSDDNENNDKD